MARDERKIKIGTSQGAKKATDEIFALITDEDKLVDATEKLKEYLVKKCEFSEVFIQQISKELSIEFPNLQSSSGFIKKEIIKAFKDKEQKQRELQLNELNNLELDVDEEFLNENMPLPHDLFPDVKRNKEGEVTKIKPTIGNLRRILSAYGFKAEYNEAIKQQIITSRFSDITHDLSAETSIQLLKSIAALNDIPESIINHLSIIFENNTINPVKDWILSKEWDGKDRIFDLTHTVTVDPEFVYLRKLIIETWFIQCVAALDRSREGRKLNKYAVPKYEMILVFQGAQGQEKTTWFRNLLPAELNGKPFSDVYIDTGAILGGLDVDSVRHVISYWITVLDELEETLYLTRIGAFKAFLSRVKDKMRLPYDRAECSFNRSTSFAASINKSDFLNDDTGSRRFGIIHVKELNSKHDIDMQQFWRQIWDKYENGAKWWLDKEDEQELQEYNRRHEVLDPIEEDLRKRFDFESDSKLWVNSMSLSDIHMTLFGESGKKASRSKLKAKLEKMGIQTTNRSNVHYFKMPMRSL